MNVFTFTGNIGADSVLRHTGDSAVLGFSVAVKAGYGKREQTLWIDVSLWGKRGEAIEAYTKKGQQVAVSGEFSTREHEGKTYLQVRANNVTLLGKRDQAPDSGSQGFRESPKAEEFADKDIPF